MEGDSFLVLIYWLDLNLIKFALLYSIALLYWFTCIAIRQFLKGFLGCMEGLVKAFPTTLCLQ